MPFGHITQLPRRALLAGAEPTRGLLDILLQSVDGISQSIFSFGQLFREFFASSHPARPVAQGFRRLWQFHAGAKPLAPRAGAAR
jgi:hypothetical protein